MQPDHMTLMNHCLLSCTVDFAFLNVMQCKEYLYTTTSLCNRQALRDFLYCSNFSLRQILVNGQFKHLGLRAVQ